MGSETVHTSSGRTWTPETLQAEVDSRTWFHTIDLGNGVRTPGQKDTPTEVGIMHLPDTTGRSVLDIGAYDGFYSFESERRGAARVVAADSWSWNWPGCDARRNFDLAHEVLHSSVEAKTVMVEDLSPETVGGTFDIVLFLGVLYHAPDPLGYLKAVRSVTAGVAVVETIVDLLDIDVPAAAYYAADSMNADSSNVFGPNPAAVEGMLLDAGFARVTRFDPWTLNKWYSIHSPTSLPTTVVDKVRWRLQQRFGRDRSGRMVFHAFV
jgi:tRNA (mo5U34)-methyltransferase